MNEALMSLPEVIKEYSGKNLLLPTSTDVQLNPFYKYHIEEVPVDLSETSGDVFKVGSVNTGRKENGKDVWVDTYSLSKSLLNKLAMAARIQFNPEKTYGKRIDKMTYAGYAHGAIQKPDGSVRTEVDQKVICLEDEEDKYRIEFMDKAQKGISDEKQAKAAAELFKGTFIQMTNKYGKTVQGYLIDECDRQKYIERSVMVNMALLRKTWAEKAVTGAKLRVIRALLGVKGTYTREELSKNFVIPTVVFSPDYTDPQIRQAMLIHGMNSVNNMFGAPALPIKRVEFDEDDTFEADDYIGNDAFKSDSEEDGFESDYKEAPVPENLPTPEQEQTPAGPDYQCTGCGVEINERVYEYSINKFGRPLCIKCQKGAK